MTEHSRNADAMPDEPQDFTDYRAWSAEGARVALVTCKKCGAAVLIDPTDKESATEVHKRWHLWHDSSGNELLA